MSNVIVNDHRESQKTKTKIFNFLNLKLHVLCITNLLIMTRSGLLSIHYLCAYTYITKQCVKTFDSELQTLQNHVTIRAR